MTAQQLKSHIALLNSEATEEIRQAYYMAVEGLSRLEEALDNAGLLDELEIARAAGNAMLASKLGEVV